MVWILDFGMNDLTHHSMTCLGCDVKRRCLYMTLFRKSPFVILFRELRDRVVVLCSSQDGLECFCAVDGLGCAGDTGYTKKSDSVIYCDLRSLCPLPHCIWLVD